MKQVYIICSGGGSGAISAILERGGASSFFLGAEIPYSQHLLTTAVGGEVWDGRYTSERTAHQLAAAAYNKAKQCSDDPLGIGACATLCKVEGEREGRVNQIFVAVKINDHRAATYHYTFLSKTRETQEQTCNSIIHRLAIEEYTGILPKVWDIEPVEYNVDHNIFNVCMPQVFVLCGSFNPFHNGHYDMIRYVRENYRSNQIIEIASTHHNKPSITAYEYNLRKDNILKAIPDAYVVCSKTSLFVDKQREYKKILPTVQIIFMMGADVYNKITEDEKDQLNMLVFARDNENVAYHKHAVIVHDVVESQSSTEIRKQQREQKHAI